MFNTVHILYMVISAAITAGLLILAAYKAKEQSTKDKILKAAAVVTVLIHYSNLWVDYLAAGVAEVENNHLFLVHPCNVIMWLLVLAAFLPKKEGTFYEILSEFVFWGGIVCGSIGIIFNANFDANPTLADYDVLKGLVSHSTMIFGCIYLRVGGYMSVRVFNVLSGAAGMLFFLLDGAIVNGIFALCGLESVNSMYLQESPFADMPWLNPPVMGIAAIVLLFSVTALYELRLPKDERWYSKLKVKVQELGLKKK